MRRTDLSERSPYDCDDRDISFFFFARSCWVLQLSHTDAECSQEDMMVPVLSSKKASELPVNEVACSLQVSAEELLDF